MASIYWKSQVNYMGGAKLMQKWTNQLLEAVIFVKSMRDNSRNDNFNLKYSSYKHLLEVF